MKIGYARVSTHDQSLDLQMDALAKGGCDRVFSDVVSGAREQRPGLAQALEFLRPSDTLVVWKLDRLARSLKNLMEIVSVLSAREVGFQCLSENIDTTTSSGKLFFHVFGAIAEFERDLIRERTQAGIAAARARGRLGGRPPKLKPQDLHMANLLLSDPKITVGEVCKKLGVGRSTLYRHLAALKPRNDQ